MYIFININYSVISKFHDTKMTLKFPSPWGRENQRLEETIVPTEGWGQTRRVKKEKK